MDGILRDSIKPEKSATQAPPSWAPPLQALPAQGAWPGRDDALFSSAQRDVLVEDAYGQLKPTMHGEFGVDTSEVSVNRAPRDAELLRYISFALIVQHDLDYFRFARREIQ